MNAWTLHGTVQMGVLSCRRQPDVLVARPGGREAELLGRLPAGSAAVLVQPGGELHGHELLLQLRRRHRLLVRALGIISGDDQDNLRVFLEAAQI